MTNPSIASDLDYTALAMLQRRRLDALAQDGICEIDVAEIDEAITALSQLTREVDDILDEADFLCARLRELENELSDDHTARQFYGHVAPSLARMEALSRSSGRVSDAAE